MYPPFGAPQPEINYVFKSATSTDTALKQVIPARIGFQFIMTVLVIDNGHATQETGVTIKGGSSGDWGPLPAAEKHGGCCPHLNSPFPFLADTDASFVSSNSASVTVSMGGYWTPKGGY